MTRSNLAWRPRLEPDADLAPVAPVLVTAQQAAQALGISVRHLQKLDIPAVRIGRAVRYRPATLATWAQQRECSPASDSTNSDNAVTPPAAATPGEHL